MPDSEEQLKLYRLLVEHSLGLMCIHDLNGVLLSINPAAAQALGYNPQECVGRSLRELLAPSVRQLFDDYVQRIRRNYTDSGLMRLRAKDGAERIWYYRNIRVEEPGGFPRVLGHAMDLTERIRVERALRVVADLSREALAGCDLEWLLNQAVVVIAETLEVEFSQVLELTPAGHELILRAGVGWSEGCVGVSRVPARGDSQASYTLQRGEPTLVEDLTKETRFRPAALLLDHSVVSGMNAVIHGRGQPHGVLGAHTARKRRFNSHEAHFLQSIADVLAEAIMRRQLEEELLGIIDREQRRIGHDMHDGLCQQLAGIEFRTVVLVNKLASHPGARKEAEKIGALLRDSMLHVQILSRGLGPVDLEADGLMAALGQLATSCGQLYGITCQFHCDPPVLIGTQETATHLYRIAQEAISNAIKHGHAKTIVIDLRQTESEAVLSVTNDGVPIPLDVRYSGGMGLRIMRYRVEMIGGTLRIAPTAEGKTAVICSFRAVP